MESITETSIKNVCSVSVHTMVLIPPLCVYVQIKRIEIITVISNGMFQESNTNCCKTIATKNRRNEAPIIREIKKKNAPVFWVFGPNLIFKYS